MPRAVLERSASEGSPPAGAGELGSLWPVWLLTGPSLLCSQAQSQAARQVSGGVSCSPVSPHLPAEPLVGLASGEPPPMHCVLQEAWGTCGHLHRSAHQPLGRALEGAGLSVSKETPPRTSPARSWRSSSGGRELGLWKAAPETPCAANVSLSQQALGGPPTTSPPWDRPPQSSPSRWTPMSCLKLVPVPVRSPRLLSHTGERGAHRPLRPTPPAAPAPSPGWCGVFFLVMAPAQGQQDPLFARLSRPRCRRSLGSLLRLCPRPAPTRKGSGLASCRRCRWLLSLRTGLRALGGFRQGQT